MKTKYLLPLLLLLLFNVIGGAAQNTKTDKPKRTVMLGQIVKDSFTGVRLKAHVTLMRQDSTVVDTTTCQGWQGNYFASFDVEAKPAKYIVKAECEGYATNCQDYEVKRIARNRGFRMPDLNLKKLAQSDIHKEVDLDGVVVTGTKVKFTYRGDTLVYNASAFNVPDGSMLDGHTLTLRNKYCFTDIANLFYLKYTVLANGSAIETGNLVLPPCAPGQSTFINIPYKDVADDGKEYVVTLSLCLKNATTWAERGYEMVAQQFAINAAGGEAKSVADPTFVQQPRAALPAVTAKGKLKVKGNAVTGDNFSLSFDADGSIASWTYNGTQIVEPSTGPDFSGFRRIANDNVSLGATGGVAKNDNLVGGALTGKKTLVKAPRKVGKNVVVETAVANSVDTHAIRYTIYPDGTVDMRIAFNNSNADNRRVGITMQFAPGMEKVDYYAKGPWSNYIDRQRGSLLGLYQTTVDGMFEELSAPQTMGDRQGLRFLQLTGNGIKLGVQTEGQLAFSLSHIDDAQLDYDVFYGGKHPYDLVRKPQVFAHFDFWQRGIGNRSCGGDSCLPQYLTPTGEHVVMLRFKPTAE